MVLFSSKQLPNSVSQFTVVFNMATGFYVYYMEQSTIEFRFIGRLFPKKVHGLARVVCRGNPNFLCICQVQDPLQTRFESWIDGNLSIPDVSATIIADALPFAIILGSVLILSSFSTPTSYGVNKQIKKDLTFYRVIDAL